MSAVPGGTARSGNGAPVPDAAQPLLAVSGLSKAFGGVKAVREVAFTLERGEMLAMIGPNGAGKSTRVKLLNGLVPDERG